MHKTTPLIPAALGAIALLPAAAAAQGTGPEAHSARVGHKVVLFKSVGGISLGTTPKAVKRKLGRPSHTIRVAGKIAELEYNAKDADPILHVEFDTNNRRDLCDGVFGYARDLHTSKGIHPGSPVSKLKRAYKHSGLKKTGVASYTLYQGTPGAIGYRETDFGALNGKVEDIGIQTAFKDF